MNLLKRLFRTPTRVIEQPAVSLPPRIITENEVMVHCRQSGGTSYMCKNCGAKHDALAVTRQYCAKCNCWICHRCSGSLCTECKNKIEQP